MDARKDRISTVEPPLIMTRELAEQIGMMLAIHIEFGRWEHCHRVIDMAKGDHDAAQHRPAFEDCPLAALGLDVRVVNALEREGVFTLPQLLEMSADELRIKVPRIGELAVDQLQSAARKALGGVMPGTVTRGRPRKNLLPPR